MKKINILKGALTLFFVLFLAACSGGGDSAAPPPSTEGVWDQMNWNEKNWQ